MNQSMLTEQLNYNPHSGAFTRNKSGKVAGTVNEAEFGCHFKQGSIT